MSGVIQAQKMLTMMHQPRVLKRAVAAWKFVDGLYEPATDEFVDITGHGIGLRMGSAVGADTNDPVRLLLNDGGKRVYFPGVAGNSISTPDSAALNATTALDVVVLAQNLHGATVLFASKSTTTGNQRSWRFGRLVGGEFFYAASADGTTEFVNNSQAIGTSLVAGAYYWFRFTFESDNGSGKCRFRFYTAAFTGSRVPPSSWTLEGTNQLITSTTLFGSTAALEIGSHSGGTAQNFTGSIIYGEIRTAVGGAPVASIDTSQLSEPYASYTDPQGNVWTLNRSASGRKLAVVDRDMLLLGSDDYLTAADNTLLRVSSSESLTLAAAVRVYGTQASDFADVMSKMEAGVGNYVLEIKNSPLTPYTLVTDGITTVQTIGPSITAGKVVLLALVLNRASGKLLSYVNTTATTGADASALGAVAPTTALQIGKESSGTKYTDMEISAAAVFHEALTTNDLRRLMNELGVAA